MDILNFENQCVTNSMASLSMNSSGSWNKKKAKGEAIEMMLHLGSPLWDADFAPWGELKPPLLFLI